jgi:hypothetical protein
MVPVRQTKTCTQRYHDGTGATPVALCACSTFAIGVCADCGEPVCGDNECSWLRDRRRLCRKHTIEFDTAAEAAAASAAEAAANAAEAAATALRLQQETVRREWQEKLAEILRPLHEFDRLLRVIRLATSAPTDSGHYRRVIRIRTDFVQDLLGSTFGTESETEPKSGTDSKLPLWDDVELSKWFASLCHAPTERVTPHEERGRSAGKWGAGWSKPLKPVDAWTFVEGSTLGWSFSAQRRSFMGAAICSDGRRLYAHNYTFHLPFRRDQFSEKYSQVQDRLNAWALAQMADLLQLPLLPEPPIPLPERPVM